MLRTLFELKWTYKDYKNSYLNLILTSVCNHRSALQAAKASEVAGLLGRLAFQPRAPAFTKMLQQCGTDVAKAFELWLAMHRTPGVKANTISYRYALTTYSMHVYSESMHA